jgi:hypothetical protein
MPVLVGISQIVTQWMTPQAGVDPAAEDDDDHAARADLRLRLGAGGALIYWLVGNVWRLGGNADELPDWSPISDDTSGRRTACETRRRREDRRCEQYEQYVVA